MLTSSDWTMTNTNTNTAATTTSTSTTSDTSSTSSSGLVSNPNATLDKDAFLKLLLIELQHQDPTDPMDSDKMLTQTSQLSALEMQQNTNTTMQKMVETMQLLSNSFSTSMSTSAIGAIGKMATVSDNKIKLTGSDEVIALKCICLRIRMKMGLLWKYTIATTSLYLVKKVANNLFLKGSLRWVARKK